MVNLNSWSNALQGAQQNQNVQLGAMPQEGGKVEGGNLGGRAIQLVPSDKSSVQANRETREKLFQALQGGVGTSKAEQEFIEKTRQDLGLDAKGKATGDQGLKALEARTIVNLGRAQEKNVSAMLDKSMNAIRSRVPANVINALKTTILQQANHPDVIAFLDKYGSGQRDLKTLQRVYDLALELNQGDRMTQAYMRGFRGTERCSQQPLVNTADVELAEQQAQSMREEQLASDNGPEKKEDVVRQDLDINKDLKSGMGNSNIKDPLFGMTEMKDMSSELEDPKEEPVQKPIDSGAFKKIGGSGLKSKTGVMSRKEILGEGAKSSTSVMSRKEILSKFEVEAPKEEPKDVPKDEPKDVSKEAPKGELEQKPINEKSPEKIDVPVDKKEEQPVEDLKDVDKKDVDKKAVDESAHQSLKDLREIMAKMKADVKEARAKYEDVEKRHAVLKQEVLSEMRRVGGKGKLSKETRENFAVSRKQCKVQREALLAILKRNDVFVKTMEPMIKKTLDDAGVEWVPKAKRNGIGKEQPEVKVGSDSQPESRNVNADADLDVGDSRKPEETVVRQGEVSDKPLDDELLEMEREVEAEGLGEEDRKELEEIDKEVNLLKERAESERRDLELQNKKVMAEHQVFMAQQQHDMEQFTDALNQFNAKQ